MLSDGAGNLLSRLGELRPYAMRDECEALGELSNPNFQAAFVYFVKADLEEPLVKIGVTANLRKRCGELSTYSPVPLALVAAERYGTFNRARAREAEIHGMLKEFRTHGEWFTVTPTVQQQIDDSRFFCDLDRGAVVFAQTALEAV
jgi:hypothetical protein